MTPDEGVGATNVCGAHEFSFTCQPEQPTTVPPPVYADTYNTDTLLTAYAAGG